MVRRTRWRKDWHHRVPDFKLVYCGPKNRDKEEAKELTEKRMIETAIIDDRNVAIIEGWRDRNRTEKS